MPLTDAPNLPDPELDRLKAIQRAITAGDKSPFQRILADLLGCAPSADALQTFADKAPDRWAQALTIVSKLAGYKETAAVENNFYLTISSMSDAALLHELQSLNSQLAGRVIEHAGGITKTGTPEIAGNPSDTA